MSRGIKDLRELINVSRLTHRPDDVLPGSGDSEEHSDACGDSLDPNSRLSSASSGGAQSTSLDSGLGGGSPKEPTTVSEPRKRRQRGRRRQLPPLQSRPEAGAGGRVTSSPALPQSPATVNFDAVLERVDSGAVTDWLERATVFAHELSLWCGEGVNFVAFADFWLSDFPVARKRDIVQLEASVLLDEMCFAFRDCRQAELGQLLSALFHEYPARLLGNGSDYFFLDYLDVLSSERSNDYRKLLTDVRLSTRNRLHAQWCLSIRSFALLSSWSAVVGFFRELTTRGNVKPVRPQTANNKDLPSNGTNAIRVIQAVSHGFRRVLDYYIATKRINVKTFKDDKGRNLIFLAVAARQAVILRHLITQYRQQIDLNCRSETGNTPLHAAVTCGDLDVVRILVEGGADIDAANPVSDNSTPLHLAILYGHSAIVAFLLDHGASITVEMNGVDAAGLAKEFEQTYIHEMIMRLTAND